MGKINWNQRYKVMKQGGGSIPGRPGIMKMNNDNPDKEKTAEEMTLKELEAAVRRKKLKEELAKKANKQTRDFDESMLGVCHTCHVPVYYGEPLHKLQTRDDESNYSGMAGGGYTDTGFGKAGGIAWKGNKRNHSELEGWIQCGFCYGSWKEDIEALKKWESGWKKWGLIIGIPVALIACLPPTWAWYITKDKADKFGNLPSFPLYAVIIWAFLGYCLGAFIGGMIFRFRRGKKPEPDRYKIRENPYRDTLIWKLDNEGNPIKEGSMKVNKYGMILDPERDKELKTTFNNNKENGKNYN